MLRYSFARIYLLGIFNCNIFVCCSNSDSADVAPSTESGRPEPIESTQSSITQLDTEARLLLALFCFGREEWQGAGKARGISMFPGRPLTAYGRLLLGEERCAIDAMRSGSFPQAQVRIRRQV